MSDPLLAFRLGTESISLTTVCARPVVKRRWGNAQDCLPDLSIRRRRSCPFLHFLSFPSSLPSRPIRINQLDHRQLGKRAYQRWNILIFLSLQSKRMPHIVAGWCCQLCPTRRNVQMRAALSFTTPACLQFRSVGELSLLNKTTSFHWH